MKQFASFLTIPFALSIPPILGWFLGQWLDKKLGTTPYLMYFLIIAGIIAGWREVYRIIRRYGDDS